MGRSARSEPQVDEVRALAACQQGDRNAYELIVERYKARAIGVARSILRDVGLAEDVAQEAFVRAFRAVKRFRLEEPFYPWFYRILKNCCLTALKRRKRRVLSLDVEDAPPVAAPPNDPSHAASREELKAQVRYAMTQVSDKHREILHLSHFDGLAYKEIAGCLRIPIGTVMSRLWAARQALKKVMEKLLHHE
ncbi:MAG: sigma-70 family RNA polymerase sigma factor [Planctomycetota bacterium]|nr:sigma-70 family RNA polymerase sigma factor [Planctomycetota bacterium]